MTGQNASNRRPKLRNPAGSGQVPMEIPEAGNSLVHDLSGEDAVKFKYTAQKLTDAQVKEVLQIPAVN